MNASCIPYWSSPNPRSVFFITWTILPSMLPTVRYDTTSMVVEFDDRLIASTASSSTPSPWPRLCCPAARSTKQLKSASSTLLKTTPRLTGRCSSTGELIPFSYTRTRYLVWLEPFCSRVCKLDGLSSAVFISLCCAYFPVDFVRLTFSFSFSYLDFVDWVFFFPT